MTAERIDDKVRLDIEAWASFRNEETGEVLGESRHVRFELDVSPGSIRDGLPPASAVLEGLEQRGLMILRRDLRVIVMGPLTFAVDAYIAQTRALFDELYAFQLGLPGGGSPLAVTLDEATDLIDEALTRLRQARDIVAN